MGRVPADMTAKVNETYVCMKGTEEKPVRCVALEGVVAKDVRCSIYDLRSSTCRDFMAGSEVCNRARALFDLPPI